MTNIMPNTAPIFVVGAPRSGTTLMSRILGLHPEVFSSGESNYFEDIWTRREALGSLVNEEELEAAWERLATLFGRFNFLQTQRLVDVVVEKEVLIQRTLAMGGGYGNLYYAFTQMLAERFHRQRVCDDTPKHLYYVPAIVALLPQAKIIGCVRDPRDFLCSYKNYWRRSTESDRVKALYHPVVTSFLWRSSANLLGNHMETLDSDRIMLVQYEKLVRDPEDEVRRVCNFLRIAYSDELLQVSQTNSSYEGEVATRGIFTTSIGRWQKGLASEEVWWCQSLNRHNMQQLGYEVKPVKPSLGRLLSTLMSTPFALLRALRANAAKRGPLLRYLMRRIGGVLRR